MANKRRTFKVAEKIREVISTELLHLADPRLTLITITQVVVSSDLGHAKIYWNVMGDAARIPEVEKAFAGAAGHFRSVVAKDLDLRFAPSLSFYYDTTMDTVQEVDRLLKRIPSETAK